MVFAPLPGPREAIEDDSRSGCEEGASDGGDEREADLLVVEVVDGVQHDGDGDEEGEDDGEVKAEVEAYGDDEGFSDEHFERGEEGCLEHGVEGGSARGGCEVVGDAESFRSRADDGSGVGFRHADAEEVGG